MLFHHREEGGWDGGGEFKELARDGVHERDGAGMERKTVDRGGTGTIAAVAGYGMAEIVHVHAYLVLAASLQFHLHKGVAIGAFERLIVCNGKFPLLGIVGGVYDILRVFGEVAAHFAGGGIEFALNHAYILATAHHIVPVVL